MCFVFSLQVCSKLCEKFGKHGLVKPKQAVRSLVTPLRMNAGMDDDVAPKKQPEVFEGPLLSSRDKAKIERKKRKDERQREVICFLLCQWLILNRHTMLCHCLSFLIFVMVDANVFLRSFLPDYALLYTVLLAGPGTISNACRRDGST